MPPTLIPRHFYRQWPASEKLIAIGCAVDGCTYTVPPGAFVRSDLLVGSDAKLRKKFGNPIKARYLPVEDAVEYDGLAIVMPVEQGAPATRGMSLKPKSVVSDCVLVVLGGDDGSLPAVARTGAHVAFADTLFDVPPDADRVAVVPRGTPLDALGPGWLARAPILSEHPENPTEPYLYLRRSKLRCAVVVTVYNAPEVAVPCIEAILRHTDPRHPLIIVDDGSEPKVRELVSGLISRANMSVSITHIIKKNNGGYREAVNGGIESALNPRVHDLDDDPVPVDAVCVVNSDILVTPEWLERMLVAVEETGASLVNPHCNDAAMMSLPLAGHKLIIPWRGLKQGAHYQDIAAALLTMKPRYPAAVTSVGNCMLITREAWEAYGPFDAVYGRGYGEECELWAKVIEGGGRAVIADDAYVFHESHATHGGSATAAEKAGVKLFLERHGKTYAAQAHQLSSWPSATAHARGIVNSATLTGLPVQLFAVDVGQYGGAYCLVRLVTELRKWGICAQMGHLKEPTIAHTPTFGWLRHASEQQFAAQFKARSGWATGGVLVASHWSTAKLVNEVVDTVAGVVPMAFWQDREDFFTDQRGNYGLPKARRDSYVAIPNRVYNAEWVFDSAVDDLGAKPNEHTRHIQVGVDTLLFRPTGAPREPGPIRILSMWRPHTPRRGSKRLKAVYDILRAQFGARVSLEVFGWGDPVPAGVKNHGKLSQRGVAKLVRSVDILIEPSDYQGFGLPALEAMASGVAVVSTPTKGVQAYFEPGALIVTADHEPATVAASIAALVEDDAARIAMGLKGRERALEFDWSRIGARWVVYLRDLWAAKGTEPAYQPHLDAAAELAEAFLNGDTPHAGL